MNFNKLPSCFQDIAYCLCGCDSTTGCMDLIPIFCTSLFCFGACNKCCCAQRSMARKVANYDPRIMVYSSESPEVHKLIARSFSGTEKTEPEYMLDWVVGEPFADRSNPKRIALVNCFMGVSASMEGEKGLVLGVTDGNIHNPKLEAVLVARKVKNNSIKSCGECVSYCAMTGHLCRLLCRNECVWDICDDKRFEERANTSDKVLLDMKKFSVGKEPAFWYVAIVAVDPSAQGKKHASRLMHAILQQADIDGLPTHLECSSDKNRQIYERFGFYPVYRTQLEWTDSQHSNVSGYAMYRPAKGKSISDFHQVIDCSNSSNSIEAQVMEREGNIPTEPKVESELM